MRKLSVIYFTLCLLLGIAAITALSGCANIIPPGGGPRDTLPPELVLAVPKDSTINFTGNKITLNFNEYVEIQNAFENLLVSPLPKNMPVVNYNFRTVTVKIKDTLEPNTTYSINFGNAIKDINEGNVFKNFTYVFSTGAVIDQNTISGKVVMAETGKIDSTLIVVLHRSLDDSAVVKERPRYLAKLDGTGSFKFKNLAAGSYALYALPNDYSKKYDDTTKPFAFADSAINSVTNTPVTLYAYQLHKKDASKPVAAATGGATKDKTDKPLRVTTDLETGRQDLLKNMEITFSRKIKAYDTAGFILTDTNFNRISNYSIVADTANNRFTLVHKWLENTPFELIVDRNAFTDSLGQKLVKNDTVRFYTKRNEDYGSVKLRFNNLDLSKNPVLQIVSGDKIIEAVPLVQREWSRKLFTPGEYDLRILFDKNKNGVWDPGKFFGTHLQPEIVIPVNTKLNVRANWDNEKDVTF